MDTPKRICFVYWPVHCTTTSEAFRFSWEYRWVRRSDSLQRTFKAKDFVCKEI